AGGISGPLEVNPGRSTSLVDVAYISSSPRLAQQIAESIGESYIRLNNEKKFESVREASEFLDRQIAQIRADIEVTRRQLQLYGESKGIIPSADASSIPYQRLMKVNPDVQTATNLRLEKQNA